MPCTRMGCAEGQSPFAGGAGVPPAFGFITPFLARACPEPAEGKGDRGMVETVFGEWWRLGEKWWWSAKQA